MKEIIINDSHLIEDDMDDKVIRVKALIFNSNGEILLVHNNNTYQFPGGHKKSNESIDDTILREIKEEIGIDLEIKERPFLCISTYDDNYFDTGKKVLNSIYYYRFFTDLTPNFKETSYDDLELESDFNLYYLKFDELDTFLKKCINRNNIDKKIAREMLQVVVEYREIFGGE